MGEGEVVEEDLVEALARERERHLVDRRDVARRDDRPLVHVAEERDLLLHLLGNRAVGPAEEDVGLDSDREKLLDGVLRGLRLQLVGGRDVRHERQVHVDRVAAAHVLAELADRLEERQRLDVADGAADLHEDDVVVARDAADAVLDLVRDVRNDLDGLAEEVAAALLLDDRQIDLSGRHAVRLAGDGGGEALVVPEVEIGLGAVVGDVDLAVLERRHRAGVHVQVGIELLEGDAEPARFQERAHRRGGDALAEARDHAAGDENVLGSHATPPLIGYFSLSF